MQTYTYTQDGKLLTKIWARLNNGQPLTTTYSYDPNTGEMLTTDYSDSTPDLAFTYDRMGRQKTVTDAVGTRAFTYNSNLQLDSENITGLYNKVITRDYEVTGMIGRSTGFHIGTEYDVDYGYDGYGRFNSVTAGSEVFTYGYLANSNLIESLSMPNNISVTNSFEPHRNLATSVANKYGETIVSQYAYSYDAAGRRQDVVHAGTAFAQSNFNKWL